MAARAGGRLCARKVKRKLYLLLEIDVGSVTMFGGGGCQEIQPSIGASPLSEAGGEGRGGGLGRSHDISCTPPRYGSELVAEFGSQLWNLRKRSTAGGSGVVASRANPTLEFMPFPRNSVHCLEIPSLARKCSAGNHRGKISQWISSNYWFSLALAVSRIYLHRQLSFVISFKARLLGVFLQPSSASFPVQYFSTRGIRRLFLEFYFYKVSFSVTFSDYHVFIFSSVGLSFSFFTLVFVPRVNSNNYT